MLLLAVKVSHPSLDHECSGYFVYTGQYSYVLGSQSIHSGWKNSSYKSSFKKIYCFMNFNTNKTD